MMTTDSSLTQRLRQYALDLGADLVGVASVSRYEHAPLLLSPQGHWPEAKNVVVIAVHHGDAVIEMGGRPTPHDMGPYSIQNMMNARMEHIVWALSRFLEESGWKTMPMPATNIWRFRPYGEVDRPFVPDLSNIHAAAAAGLGEIGWSGLLLSPEFGPRNRFCTLITEAPLEPSPLYDGPPLCDHCLMCAKYCQADALDKEVDGECQVRIEDKVMTYANKNLWRCAWGEHFGLDLSLPKPDEVTEEVLLQNLAEHGQRGGEMGSCLRHCLPPHLRHFDSDYTDTVRRRPDTSGDGKPVDRPATWAAHRLVFDWGVDVLAVADADQCRAAGLELPPLLTDGQRLLTFALQWPEGCRAPGEPARPTLPVATALADLRGFVEMDLVRLLERHGYAAVPHYGVPLATAVTATGLGVGDQSGITVEPYGQRVVVGCVVTSCPLERGRVVNPQPVGKDVAALIRSLAGQGAVKGAQDHLDLLVGDIQMVGVATSERLDAVAAQLESLLDQEAMVVNLVDAGGTHGPVIPEPARRSQPVIRRPGDHLPGARSVVVLGTALPALAIDRATEPPAESVGPYAAAVYQSRRELRYAAARVAVGLETAGYRAAVVDDVLGTASAVANPRGRQPDANASRFAAVAAGLGTLLHTGAVWALSFGVRARFISVVTDAPLPPTPLVTQPPPCPHCPHPCLSACPTQALSADTYTVAIDGHSFSFGVLDWLRCDWAKKYALTGAAGPRWMGSRTDLLPPPGPVTEEVLTEAYASLDPVQKHWLCIMEPCLRSCFRHCGGDVAGDD